MARALIREPEFLLLDEPFASVDPLTRVRMRTLVSDFMARAGPVVLLVTHDVDEALLLADRALAIEHGRIAAAVHIDADRPRDPS